MGIRGAYGCGNYNYMSFWLTVVLRFVSPPYLWHGRRVKEFWSPKPTRDRSIHPPLNSPSTKWGALICTHRRIWNKTCDHPASLPLPVKDSVCTHMSIAKSGLSAVAHGEGSLTHWPKLWRLLYILKKPRGLGILPGMARASTVPLPRIPDDDPPEFCLCRSKVETVFFCVLFWTRCCRTRPSGFASGSRRRERTGHHRLQHIEVSSRCLLPLAQNMLQCVNVQSSYIML